MTACTISIDWKDMRESALKEKNPTINSRTHMLYPSFLIELMNGHWQEWSIVNTLINGTSIHIIPLEI